MKNISFTKAVIIFVSVITMTSCTFNTSYHNNEGDKHDAEQITLKLYASLQDQQYNKTHKLFSPRFMAVTDTSKLNDIYRLCDKRLGEIKGKEIDAWKTKVVKGSNPKSEYLLVYKVKRDNFNSTVSIRLEKENDTIKILSYHVDSEGFNDYVSESQEQ